MRRTIKKLTAENWQFKDKISEIFERLKLKESDVVSITQSSGRTTLWFWAEKNSEGDLWEGIEW